MDNENGPEMDTFMHQGNRITANRKIIYVESTLLNSDTTDTLLN